MKPDVVVLGAGPAGLGAAYRLTSLGLARVTVLEQQARVGGNSGSFEFEGVHADYGSHRLHPACDPAVLDDLRRLLGGDLLLRPRHGRIHLRGRWVHFPLRPANLAANLPRAFVWCAALDAARRPFARTAAGVESFASMLESAVGRTLCEWFYFPYARKLWGVDPDSLSAAQARRRIRARSPGALLRKVLHGIPGFTPHGAVEHDGKRIKSVRCECNGAERTIETEHVWSTLPLNALIECIRPAAPQPVVNAARAIRFRGLILVYLAIEEDCFSEYDAHYFPDAGIPMVRLSEPKNYSGTLEPRGVTVLCAEVPSDPGSAEWQAGDKELGSAVCEWLAAVGLPVRARVRSVTTRRLPYAYPVWLKGYEAHRAEMENWIDTLGGLLTFGRQGLFAHDNLHHALYMAYSAAACLKEGGGFDREKWAGFREIFDRHVVED